MAMLERPGVEVIQQISVIAPTILLPGLPACIVGPCYQIVSPLTSSGTLDSASQIITAAQIVGTTVVNPIAASGKQLKIRVNGSNPQVITLPVTINDNPLSFTLIKQSINKQLLGARCDFVNSKLVITSNTKGAAASIEIMTQANDAYSLLGISVGSPFTGSSNYTNLAQTIPFLSLPSPLAPVAEVTFYPDQLTAYRYFGNTLYALSDKSAVNQNSWSMGTQTTFRSTTIDDAAEEYQNRLQPALSTRSRLIGKPLVGASKTNTVFDPGTEASVTIPLGHLNGGGAVKYPDGSGHNYLKITALGLQNYLAGAGTVGPNVGKLGNTITVVITQDEGGTAGTDEIVAWDSGTKTLTITLVTAADLVTSTFKHLDDAFAAATGNPELGILIDLVYDAAVVGASVLGGLNIGTDLTFYLVGGVNPVDFSATPAADKTVAGITGCVKMTGVTAGSTDTATVVPIAGETLSISLNGSAWKDILFGTGDNIATTLNTAMDALATGATATVLTSLVSQHGDALSVLQLKGVAPTGSDYHDSTIQIKASSPKVIEKLFGGAVAKTYAFTGITVTNGRKTASIVQTAYNSRALAKLEKALVPGAQTVVLSGVKGLASVVFATTDAVLNALAGATFGKVTVAQEVTPGAGFTTAVLTSSITLTDLTTVKLLVADLTLQIAGSTLAGLVTVAWADVGGKKLIIFSDRAGTGTIKVTALAATGADAGESTAFKAAILNGATEGSILGVTKTSAASVTVTIKDTGALNTLQVTSVSNALAHVVFPTNLTFATTSATDLTALLLDPYAGDAGDAVTSSINHTTGDVVIKTLGGAAAVTASESLRFPAIILLANANTATIAWSQAWANGIQAVAPDYTGRVFHGMSCATIAGDSLYNAGSQMGKIAAVQNLSIGTFTFTGAQLVLSDATVSNLGVLSDWYIKAEALDINTTRDIEPEISVSTLDSVMTVKHGVNTNSAGITIAGTNAPLYAGYKALRLDVSPASTTPSLLVFNNTEEVAAAIGPVTPDNPLAYGLSKAFENSEGVSVTALGIDEISADAPNGTPEAYSRAFDYLKLKEVYAIAPLTYDRSVHGLLAKHCTVMSAVTGKKERAGIVCVELPTEREALACISGTMTISDEIGLGSGKFELTFTDDTKDAVGALDGKTDALGNTLAIGNLTDCDVALGIFVDRSGDAYKYIVTKVVSATTVQIEARSDIWDAGGGPGTQGNDDGFYKEDAGALDDFSVVGEMCTILVRQAAIDAMTTTGKLEQMDALASYGSSFGMSRFVVKQPARFETELGGTTIVVDGFYACAAEAGMVGFYNPKQGFTNFKMFGFSKPLGSNDTYTEDEMATAAAGGINWMVQDSVGGPMVSRHSLTTNISSLKTREWNVIRQIDFATKLMRNTAKPFIGPNNVTDGLLQELSMVLGAAASNISGTVVQSCSVDRVIASTTNPDQILITVSIRPFYAANKIIVTLLV